MSLVDRVRNLSKTEKIVISSIAAVVIVAVVAVIILIANNRYLATTMRLLRVEGTVNIEDSSGNIKPVIDNIRFQSGDALSTGSDGLASVSLDETKIVTLESDSRVEFNKQGKQLELNLTQGALFFEVTEKLADDEKYEIKTSNMTVGIRGTSGYVYYSESGLQSLIITDGVVQVTGYNPKTKETKTVEVRGGEKVTAYLYDDSTDDRDSIEFELTEVSEEELPEFPLQMLAENEALLDKVCADTGWNKDELLALVVALTDPEGPTPTPDAIITITDTPTPAAKPKVTLAVSPTPTETTTPSPKPTAGATGTPVPTTTPATGSSNNSTPTATPIATPTATPIATPTTTITPTVKPTVTVTPIATPSPTVKPTATATPTVKPTVTTTPSATPTTSAAPSASPTVSNTPEPTDTDTPTPTPKPKPEDSIPSGYSMTDIWGENYDGTTVYICQSAGSDPDYIGWLDYAWVDLTYSTEAYVYVDNYDYESDCIVETYRFESQPYYETLIVNIAPEPDEDCEVVSKCWGTTFSGHPVFVCLKYFEETGGEPGFSWENAWIEYYGYADGNWEKLESDYSTGRLYFDYGSGSEITYCYMN